MKKSQALHRHELRIPSDNCESGESVQQNFEDSNYNTTFNLKKGDITKFLKRKHFREKKALHGKKNYSPELELYESEVLEDSTVMSDFMNSVYEENDYVDDSEDMSLKNE